MVTVKVRYGYAQGRTGMQCEAVEEYHDKRVRGERCPATATTVCLVGGVYRHACFVHNAAMQNFERTTVVRWVARKDCL